MKSLTVLAPRRKTKSRNGKGETERNFTPFAAKLLRRVASIPVTGPGAEFALDPLDWFHVWSTNDEAMQEVKVSFGEDQYLSPNL
jgi:hypothetical protein